jgi:hypothetical protein
MFGILFCRSLICKYVNKFSSLKYFHATYFGPLWPSSGIYKQQNVFTFIANLLEAMNPLLIILSHTKFLHSIGKGKEKAIPVQAVEALRVARG